MIAAEKKEGLVDWEKRVKGGSLYADGSAVIRPAEMEWNDGPIEGLRFKVTFADPNTGDWTAQIRLEADQIFPAHVNHAEVHYMILEGELHTEVGVLKADNYMRDPGGFVPERQTGPEGLTCFVKFLGGISAADANGKSVGPVVDALRVREMAEQNGLGDVLFVPIR
ncbi:ChrR Cupin-like domain-containing protein [Sphingobium faniae]|nr:ChrR Cupin-like domain-containing protein [Sphingobium faniae]